MSETDPQTPEELLSPYNPQATEEGVNEQWLKSGYFCPEKLIEDGKLSSEAEPYSMVFPPPNITGALHTGHALTIIIQDIVIRYKRMRGFRTLWLPGTDHAAIATQSRAEKVMDKEGIKKQDLSREEFFERVQDYALKNKATILNQTKRMGASLDWSREAFTLDEARQRAVYTSFAQMYEDGLIYRGYRIVNWDPKGRTTVSDDEVEHQPTTATLYTFRYSPDFPIPVATTRPETKVGDTAVAVNPNDRRYQQYLGETYTVNFAGEELTLKIIGDEEIDPEFGTGAVGVTPAHSLTDWELAERHNLEIKTIIDERGRMTGVNSELNGQKTAEAREVVLAWLKKYDLLEKEEETEQNLSTAERSGGVIEPLPKEQWFIDVNKEFTLPHSKIAGIKNGQTVTLKTLMRTAGEKKMMDFIPERYRATYFRWIDNLRNWCISRQIIYGHRIPVWYCKDNNAEMRAVSAETASSCKRPIVQTVAPEKCPHCGGPVIQDPDTLDTWFSSGLWTFSTLGWPEKTQDLELYHPTDLLETGHDILFFWIARMILMTTYHLGEIPFKAVYLHGMIRDKHNRKMSKSLDNVIDPMTEIERFGTDALRMALIVGNTPGTDLALSPDKIKAYKHFANKIWNAARFVLSNTPEMEERNDLAPELTETDREHLAELNQLISQTTKELEQYQLHIAAERLYQYFWHRFADVIIEGSKDILANASEKERRSRQWLLRHILEKNLALLHPFMPFITEKLWSLTDPDTKKRELLLISPWPKPSEK